MSKTCGIDWSERHHDVAIVDDQARVVGRARVSDDAAGFTRLLELLAEHSDGEDGPIEIAIETDKACSSPACSRPGHRVRDQSAGGGSLSGTLWAGRWQV